MSLPKVKNEIYASLYEEVKELIPKGGDEQYVKVQLKRIKRNNPAIAKWIIQYAKKYSNNLEILYGAIITYRLLESQAEADDMNSLFGDE